MPNMELYNCIKPSCPLYFRKRMEVHREELMKKSFHPNRLHYAGVKILINLSILGCDEPKTDHELQETSAPQFSISHPGSFSL